MKLAFVHHGEKIKDEPSAALTPKGRRQITDAAFFLQQSDIQPQKILCTYTQRTLESAQIISEHFSGPHQRPPIPILQKNTFPELWEDWLDFCENLYKTFPKDHIMIGHHPTLSLLNQQFDLKLSLQSYSSVIILERNNYLVWSVMMFHQGPTSL